VFDYLHLFFAGDVGFRKMVLHIIGPTLESQGKRMEWNHSLLIIKISEKNVFGYTGSNVAFSVYLLLFWFVLSFAGLILRLWCGFYVLEKKLFGKESSR